MLLLKDSPTPNNPKGNLECHMTRIVSFAALVMASNFIAPSVEAQQRELRQIQVNVFREDPAIVVGRLKNFFASEGLEVKVTRTANSTDQMRGLSNGTYQVASTAFDNVLGWSGREGVELVAVSQIIDTAVFPLYVRPEIKQWSDLRGKKLAVDAVDTAFALVLRKILLAKGLDFSRGDYELIAVGNTPLRLESMKRGDTFAGILTPPVDTQAVAAGMIRLGDSSEVLPDFPNTIFAASRAWAQNQRPTLVSFLRSWLASLAWIRANHDDAINLTGAELKVNPKVAGELVGELSTTGALNPAALERALSLRTQFGLTPPMGPDVAKYYDTQYYRAAQGR
jgi:ABC-type nitrate/sulfonate/bicarbonate transport system substrate-binding protein